MTDRAELLEAALDSLTEGVALANHEGRVVLWNRAAGDHHRIRGRPDSWTAQCARCWIRLWWMAASHWMRQNRRGERTGARMRWCRCGTRWVMKYR